MHFINLMPPCRQALSRTVPKRGRQTVSCRIHRSTRYLAAFPTAIIRALGQKRRPRKPAARQSGSPTTGIQEKSSAGDPKRLILPRALFSTLNQRSSRGCGLPYLRPPASSTPMRNVMIPPRVLPVEATRNSAAMSCSCCCTITSNRPSTPPGTSVDARIEPMNRETRPGSNDPTPSPAGQSAPGTDRSHCRYRAAPAHTRSRSTRAPGTFRAHHGRIGEFSTGAFPRDRRHASPGMP